MSIGDLFGPVFSGNVGDFLANREWRASPHPFAHYHIKDVFRPDLHAAMEAQFLDLLSRGLSETPHARRFARVQSYDAYSYGFHRDLGGPLSLFLTRGWHDVIAAAMGVEATGDVRGGLHHHTPGSEDGKVHNDFNPGWFGAPPPPGQVALSDAAVCNYHYGAPVREGVTARMTVRATAVLFYLANPPWSPGDGGETGLYAAPRRPVSEPDVAAAPINNSMLIFECSPTSWHSFISNRTGPRNSLIMWLHRTEADVAARWGADRIVKWV